MKSLKISLYIIGISLLFFNATCNSKEMEYNKEPNFVVYDAYTQLNVPGQQTEKPKLEISFKIKDAQNTLQVDSIYFQQIKALKLKKTGTLWQTKINTEERAIIDEYKGLSLKNIIILFYSENNKSYFTVVKDIQKKEAIYLP